MLTVTYRTAAGNTQTAELTVGRDEVEEALDLIAPGAEIVSVREQGTPRAPDHPDVAAKRASAQRERKIKRARRVLDRHDIDHSEMDEEKLFDSAAFVRREELRLFRRDIARFEREIRRLRNL